MAYTVAEITDLIRYHLVLGEDDHVRADHDLAELARNIDEMTTTPRCQESFYWMACEKCGTWVSSELIGPDGAGETASGGFYCTSCRYRDES